MPNALRLAEIMRALPSAVPRAAKNTLLAYYFKTFAAVGEIDRSIGKSSSMFYCFAPPISRNPAMTLRKSKSSHHQSAIDGPTERISSFVDYILQLLQPIAKAQKSCLKDTTDFINFIERTKIPKNTTLVAMDVTSLYTNIPQEQGITTVRKAYEAFYNRNIPIPTNSLKEMLQLILGENSFSFNGRNYLQTHGTAMGTKMAVAFANIFMSEVETEILKASDTKPLQWKRYIDDVFSLWGCERDKIQLFIKEANKHHATIKFTAEISEINFLDTTIFPNM